MRWTHHRNDPEHVNAFVRSLGVHRVVAEILVRLGITSEEEASRFLNPRLRGLADPFLVTHLAEAVSRLRRAIEERETVVVLGDYDVDGVTSTTFLVSVLNRFGLQPRFIVPRRMEDGYGLSRSAIERAMEEGLPSLLIAVDCGTTSVEEVRYLRERNVDVIIVDHHRCKEDLPADCVLVNPHVFDPMDAPWKNLSTVGLVFKLAHGLLISMRRDGAEGAELVDLRDFLDLVAMGTIADMVPLREENRILSRYGLRRLVNTTRPGLNALLDISGVKSGEPIHPFDISFRLGPRINASGRLADAAVPVEMLLNQDLEQCMESARLLDGFNRERQEIERAIALAADEMVESRFAEARGLVLYGEDWHPGVVGIVASRVSRKYHRPSIILGQEGEMAKGSGRSVDGLNLVEVLSQCDHLLESWGGHPLAVGVALKRDRVPEFQQAFDAVVKRSTPEKLQEPELEISVWLDPSDLGEPLLEQLELLHPFGQGNPEPVFACRNMQISSPPQVFTQKHFRFRMEVGGRRFHGVAWKMADRIPPVRTPIDFAFHLRWNRYQGRKLLQIELLDWRLAER